MQSTRKNYQSSIIAANRSGRVKPQLGIPGDPAAVDVVQASARLTGLTGLVLLVGLFVEGLTLVSIHQMIAVHIIVGMLLIPPTLLKLGSVSVRFVAYYKGDPAFRKAGPPQPILRILGPIVVASTVVLFASGIWLTVSGPVGGLGSLASGLHKASFVIWFGSMSIHVLGHLREIPKTAFADWLTRTGRTVTTYGSKIVPVRGSRARMIAVAVSIVAGLVITILTSGMAGPWGSFRHHIGAIGR